MKICLSILFCINFAFALNFDFVQAKLDKFTIQGYGERIVYKSKNHRDEQIAKLWERFLTSKDLNTKLSKDKKIYVFYTNYKANAFDCFIGLKSEININNFEERVIKKASYKKSNIQYSSSMNMSELWDDIQKQKIKRDFKQDLEVYNISDISKKSFSLDIYLSTK